MKRNILDYFAITNTENLHSKGKLATNILFEILDCKPNEKILEIGFGTAATITKLASLNRNSNFYGIEANPIMYKKGKKRIKFCFQNKIKLLLNKNPNSIPFPDNFFDKIYAESVLAIHEGENLETIISEIHRIIKPNGTLVFNEGIWIQTITLDKINTINNFCKSHFGIIQSNSDYPYTKDWENLLLKNGFEIGFLKCIDEFENKKNNEIHRIHIFSNLFSLVGKIRAKINPIVFLRYLKFKKEMKILSLEEKYMDGFLIKCTAIKS